jgi:hypothetical protein
MKIELTVAVNGFRRKSKTASIHPNSQGNEGAPHLLGLIALVSIGAQFFRPAIMQSWSFEARERFWMRNQPIAAKATKTSKSTPGRERALAVESGAPLVSTWP